MKTAVIIGGHLTPALAVMETLKHRGWRLLYIGRKHALEGDAAVSQEYRIVTHLGYTFFTLTTGRLQRSLTRHTVPSLLKIPIGCIQAIYFLAKARPQVVMSFGGYVAVPVVLAAKLLRIPVVTHEQTMMPGMSNRLIARWANAICISWSQTASLFPQKKTVFTGNPIRQSVMQVQKKLMIPHDKPVLYITGGNLGAHSINTVVESGLELLLSRFCVIHQCGNAHELHDYTRLHHKKNNLPRSLQQYYYPLVYVDEAYIGWVMQTAAVIVTRAGANIISEIIKLKKLAVCIPLPWSGSNEQRKNAAFLADRQAAVLLEQEGLTADKLFSTVTNLLKQGDTYLQQLKKIQTLVPDDAATRIADVLESVV